MGAGGPDGWGVAGGVSSSPPGNGSSGGIGSVLPGGGGTGIGSLGVGVISLSLFVDRGMPAGLAGIPSQNQVLVVLLLRLPGLLTRLLVGLLVLTLLLLALLAFALLLVTVLLRLLWVAVLGIVHR